MNGPPDTGRAAPGKATPINPDERFDLSLTDGADNLPLSATDEARLIDFERRIERGLTTFVEVGNLLAAIRQDRLYRQTHTTFEAYC
jgi:hypothetical protein